MSYQTQLTDNSTVEKNLQIQIERDAFEKRFDNELGKIATRATMKGFRQGKAPKAMVKKAYGPRVYDDVLNFFVGQAVQETIEKEKMSVIETGFAGLEKGEGDAPVEVNVTLSLLPEPEIKEYKNLEVEFEEKEFEPKLVTERIERMQEMFSELKDVEGREVVEEKDAVTISYTASFEGKEVESMKAEDQTVELGKEQLPEVIEKALIGATLGTPVTLNYDFPDAQSDEIKGKEHQFEITVSKIQERDIPELDDEFAKKTGLGESLDELQTHLEGQIKNQVAAENRDGRDAAIIDTIVAKNDFEVPQVLVDREIRNHLAEMRILDPKDKNFDQAPVEQYREFLSESAGGKVKRYIAIESLLKQEDVSVEDSDVEKMLDGFAEENGVDREQINAQYQYPQNMGGLKRMASLRKLFDGIAETCTYVAPKKEEKADSEEGASSEE